MKDEISKGGVNFASVSAREVFQNAIKKGAAGMILYHNHPSGDPTPSREDISLTKRLIEAGKLLSIEIIDHIIIGDGKFISLGREGLL